LPSKAGLQYTIATIAKMKMANKWGREDFKMVFSIGYYYKTNLQLKRLFCTFKEP
jgi:hypothetical protein